MKDIVIRLLQKDEIPQVVSIAQANNQPQEICLADLQDMFSNSNERPTYLVAVHEEKIIGFLGYRSSFMTFGVKTIFWVMVDPNFHRQGVGKLLMAKVLANIKNEGNRFSMLMTNIPEYYKKFGFYILEETEPKEYLMKRIC
jgi:predicted N-acetyltransferase YhbS